jgi:hypothetical protein
MTLDYLRDDRWLRIRSEAGRLEVVEAERGDEPSFKSRSGYLPTRAGCRTNPTRSR